MNGTACVVTLLFVTDYYDVIDLNEQVGFNKLISNSIPISH
jgi:hypothetical protein